MHFRAILQSSRHWIFYGAAMALLVFLLKWLQWKYLIADHSLEIYIGVIAVLFTALGIWVARQLTRPRVETVLIEKEVYLQPESEFRFNQAELEKLELSTREYEVLQLLGQGLSNAAIAEELCLSLSTVKTHVSNLLMKMQVKSRVQAVTSAKSLGIIP